MALTAEEKQLCADWLTEPARKWQVLNRSQWKYQFREKTLVRFVEEATMDESIVPLLLEYLTSDDCKSIIQLYGQAVSSEWAPTRAWYEISNKAVGNLKAVRLYHALSIEPENGEDGPYLVEDGCAYKVSLTYYWRQESVPQAPASESGISYRIINLSRDTENGLYSYAIEKRERVQQDIPEYVTGITTTHETREEVHLGVRGDLDAGGKQASVGGGKIVRRKVTKNADCTHDVHNETVKELASPKHSESVSVGLTGTVKTTTDLNMPAPLPTDGLDIGQHVENTKTEGGLWRRVFRKLVPNALIRIAESCRKTLFAHSHSNTTVQSNNPGFSHVEEAGGGVVHDKRVSRTADGAYQITDSTTTEKPVQKSHEAVHVGLSGKTRSVTHRNQSSPAPEPTDIGESVENSRTEGGLWNVTIRTLVKSALVKIGDACSKTIFQHSHSNTRVQGTDPGESDVLSASGGVIHERRVSRTSSGAYQINDSTTKELPVDNASESVAIGLGGKVRTTHHRNQPTKAPDPTDIGETVENQKTPGGLWNQTIKKRVLGSIIKLGENCRKTIFSHSHSKSTVQGDDPGFDHVAEAADGIIRDKRVSRTADGAYRVDETETTEKPVDKARETFNVGLSGLVRTETKRNQATPEPKPSAKDIGKKVENVKTEGGRFDVTISEIEPGQKVKTDESCRKTLTHHVHSKTEVQSDDPGFDHVAEAADGIIRDKRVSRTADGAYRVDETETTEKPVDKARKAKRMTLAGLVEEETNLYQNSKGDDNVQKVGESHSFEKTPGKGYNVTVVKKPTKGAGKIADSCSADRYLHRHVKTDNKLADGDPDAETLFEHGKITRKTKTLTALGTQNEVVEELTPKYHLDRTHWTDPVTGITYWTIKYRNAENEYKDFPSNAVNVVLNDTVNEFDLHDGILRYQIGRSYSASSTDLKFNKHGAAQVYYDVEHRRRTRVWSHRKWEVKARRIRGDMYTDYISELARANPERTSPGTLAVRLIEKYNDKDGNLLAEWVQVDLVQAEAWSVCTQGCVGKHEFAVVRWNMDHHFIINGLLQSI